MSTITLELRPEVAERLRQAAERQGQPVEAYLIKIAERAADMEVLRLDPTPGAYPPGSLAELFAQWQAEDATDDPEELRKADEELEELKANLNANRTSIGDEPLFL